MTTHKFDHDPKVEWRYGACHACHGSPCPIRAKIVEGRVVKVEGQDIPGIDGRLCAKGHAVIDQLYRPDRLKYPMRRIGKKGEGRFKRITWDEALTEIASVLSKYRDEGHPEYVHLAHGCGHIGNIPLYRYFANAYGTPNFSHHHGDTCNASGSAAAQITGAMGVPDYENAKYVLEVSHNPLGGGTARVHFSVGAFDEAIRKRAKIVVVDPRLSETAAHPATEWIPIKPGTDAALFLSLIHLVIADSNYEKEFLLNHTNAPILIRSDGFPLRDQEDNYLVWDEAVNDLRALGTAQKPALRWIHKSTLDGGKQICKTAFQLLADRAANYPPELASEITTIPADKIAEIARDIGAARPAVTVNWNEPHSCFYTNSLQAWRLRHVLGMLLGNYDAPGGMLFKPMDDVEALVEGAPTGIPTVFPFAMPPMDQTRPICAPSIELGTDSFRYPYADAIPKFTRRGISEGSPYPIKAMIVYANSLLNSHTNVQEYREALEREDLFLVVIDIWPNDHVAYADIVLPDATSLERLEVFSEWWGNNLRVVVPLLPVVGPLYETRDVSDVYIDLAHRLGLGEYFDFTKEEWFDAQLKPLGMDRNTLEEQGAYYESVEPTYHRYPHQIRPNTATGRLEIYSTSLSVLNLFRSSGDPHADPLPDHIPLAVGEPAADNEFYLLSAKCAITETAQDQDNSYLMEEDIDGLGLTALWISREAASRLGIKDGDLVRIWSDHVSTQSQVRAKVTEGIHPSAVFAFVGFGHKSGSMAVARGREGINVNEFVPDHMELLSGAAACQEALVKIEKVRQ